MTSEQTRATIRRSEFMALHSDYRHVAMDGTCSVVRWVEGSGTCLVPVAVLCDRCKREIKPWPLRRADVCAPSSWAYCIRQAS